MRFCYTCKVSTIHYEKKGKGIRFDHICKECGRINGMFWKKGE